MCIGGKSLGAIANPLGAVTPDHGPLKWLDPAKGTAKLVGGGRGSLIDPTGGLRGDYNQKTAAKTKKESEDGINGILGG